MTDALCTSWRALIVAVVLTACAPGTGADPVPAAQRVRYVTESCPLPAPVTGYPLSVIALEDASVDTTWLAEWARAAAYRWQVPSRRRASYSGYRRVTSRVLPLAPRWADDWTPDARHRAELVVTVHRAGRVAEPVPRTLSGDDLFDRSLMTIVNDPLPASPVLPVLASTASDSVRLLLRFGVEPTPGERAATVRFARQQRPVRVVPGSLNVMGPAESRAIVKYDVDAGGRLIRGSVQTLEASDAAFARAVEDGLYSARFTPAQGDCEPISLTVVQSFGR